MGNLIRNISNKKKQKKFIFQESFVEAICMQTIWYILF